MAHWLDKIIKEQAAHYGLSVDQHAKLLHGAATYQELIDSGEVEEPAPVLIAVKPERNPPQILRDTCDGIHPVHSRDYVRHRTED